MPSSSYSYPIRDLLTNLETPLGKLITQARTIEDLNRTFRDIIDPTLVSHCKVGTFENGILTLFAESASYATRVRYQIPSILSTLRNFSQWANLRSIQVKVQTHCPSSDLSVPTQPVQATLTLSPSAVSQLQTLVSTLKNKPGNEALITSLERLLEHQG